MFEADLGSTSETKQTCDNTGSKPNLIVQGQSHVNTMASTNKTFAEATSLKAKSSHTYEADFDDGWCIGSGKFHS